MEFLTGTGMFQFGHILALVLSMLLVGLLPFFALHFKLNKRTVYLILLIVGIVSESIKVFSYIIMNEGTLNGYLPKTDLPFHLCSIQLIFIAILNFSKNEKIKHLVESFMVPTCLIGGIAALVLATSSARTYWWIGLQYYGFHTAISAFAVYLLADRNTKFTVKDYRNTLIMLAITLFVAIYLNSFLYTPKFELNTETGLYEAKEMTSINFMYVVDPPQSGLPILNKNHGWGVYIAHYTCVAVFAVTCCYIKPIINGFKSLKVKKGENNNESKENIDY